MNQTGHTTVQMIAAPRSAAYVCGDPDIRYAMDLARFLGRTDLLIVRPSWLRTMRLVRPLHVVVDHAVTLTREETDGLRYLQRKARARA